MPIQIPRGRILRFTLLAAAVLLANFAPTASARPHGREPQPPAELDPKVLELATDAVRCAEQDGYPHAERLGIIDFSLPSTAERLWVIDLATGRTLFHERVAHGRGSGDDRPTRFSNRRDSNQSSLGLFRTLNPYQGANGYSLRLKGLEPDVNDSAFDRRIVMHGADYVSDGVVKLLGRLGRSFGCPAVRREIAHPLIDSLKEDQYLFAYYPDEQWLKTSIFLGCTATEPAGFVKTAE